MHIAPITFGLVTASTALSLHVYNFARWDCWIAPQANGDGERLARFLQWSFFFAPLWCAIIYATRNMILVYNEVRREEKLSMEWQRVREVRERQNSPLEDGNGTENYTSTLNMSHTKAVARQGLLYVGAFFITWMFPTISRIMQLCGFTIPPALIVLSGTFIASQG